MALEVFEFERDMRNRAGLIMTEEEMNRLSVIDFGPAGAEIGLKPEVFADVHGLSCKDAARFLRNLVRMTREPFWLVVIHGYNHGTAIRDMLRGEYIGERFGVPYSVSDERGENAGRTLFDVAAA